MIRWSSQLRGSRGHVSRISMTMSSFTSSLGRVRSAPPSPSPLYGWNVSKRSLSSSNSLKQRNRSLLLYSSALIVLFMGLSYASVPLYRIFCQKTGYAGTPRRQQQQQQNSSSSSSSSLPSGEQDSVVDMPRDTTVLKRKPIRVSFNADVAGTLPWSFRPQQKEIQVVPGETVLAFYTVENYSDTDVIGISSYNVIPDRVGSYFNKIQCFCFEDQRLGPHEKIDMPVLFYIDPSISTDPYTRNLDRIILSYTFFLSKDPEMSSLETKGTL